MIRTIHAAVFVSLLSVPLAAGAPPGEVTGLTLTGNAHLSWAAEAGASYYNVYRGLATEASAGRPLACHGDEIAGTSFDSNLEPPPGDAFLYLVTAESDADGEGTPGNETGGGERPLLGSCDAVMRNHLLDRIGHGWGEWSRDRLATLGTAAYIQEQLDPDIIEEHINYVLTNRLNAVTPPDTLSDLQAISMVRALYAWRQLESQAGLFWSNHFNTNYSEITSFFGGHYADSARRVLEAVTVLNEELDTFRDLAFNGNFHDIIRASATSPPMLIFLDTISNTKSRPNENYARELVELYTMGVDCGYTQTDIEELARVLSGWNVCKKWFSGAGDPLAACIPQSLIDTPSEPDGRWVANFRTNQHDTGEKTLFAGTAYETVIPDTSGNPADGVDDLDLALDAILAHPCTPQFISTKILQRFVTETPSQAQIDTLVAEWADSGNPQGVGDLRAVLGAALGLDAFLDPDQVGAKVKTPFEHITTAYRALRPNANGYSLVRTYLLRMQHRFHENAVPTGYPELGADWIDTNNFLERQNFGLDMASRTSNSSGNGLINLLTANGISTAPGNAEAIVDFLIDAMFGGALTPAERQAAIDYLNTDDSGVPGNYNDSRIRETAGFLLGYPQFMEQ